MSLTPMNKQRIAPSEIVQKSEKKDLEEIPRTIS
jgi:hypothetical protein